MIVLSKRSEKLISFFVCALCFMACSDPETCDRQEKASAPRVNLTVAIDDEMPGYFVFGGENYGYQYDLLKAYADARGLELEIVPYGNASERARKLQNARSGGNYRKRPAERPREPRRNSRKSRQRRGLGQDLLKVLHRQIINQSLQRATPAARNSSLRIFVLFLRVLRPKNRGKQRRKKCALVASEKAHGGRGNSMSKRK